MAEQQNKNIVNVLLVDDDSSQLQVAESILKGMDNNLVIESAPSVEEAYSKLSKGSIDIIVCDYEMPQKSGLDFLKEIRAKSSKIPFILFTGKGREEIAIQALNFGADRYLNKNGNPEAVYKELTQSIQMLHERAKAQNMLLESEERLRLFLEFAPDAVVISDVHGKFLDGNKQAIELLGYTKQELFGKDMVEAGLISPDVLPKMLRAFDEILAGRKVAPTEYPLRRKDGRIVVSEVSALAVKRRGTVEIMSIARDVTQRKSAEAELAQKHEALERVAQSIDSGLATIGRDYRVVWANSILQLKITDCTKHCYQLFNNLETICPDCGVKKVFEENAPLDIHEFEFTDNDGQPVCIELRVTPLKDKTGAVIGAIELAVEITQRKRAEWELRESEERYAKLSAAAFEGIIISHRGVILDANPQFARAHGYEVSELTGKEATQLVDPAYRDQVRANMLNGFEGPYEFLALRKDGLSFPVEVRAKPINYKGYHARVSAVLDITERKKAEAKLAAVNEKLQVVGKLTRHDIRNKLTTINSTSYILRKRYGGDPEIARHLSNIDSAVAMSNRIFDFTELYEKIGVLEQTEVDVKSCFDEALALFQNIGGIQVINDSQGLTVVADSLLRQIFYNLIDNSLKHGKGVTQIRLHYIKDESHTTLYYDDNGVGIPLENKQKIFTEHFTTNGSTGLGMSTINKVMEVYNWTIKETGVPNQGVRFEITIPTQKP